MKRGLEGWLWISPWLLGFLLFLALPAALSFFYSLTDYPLLEKPIFVGADNYARLAQDSVFWKSIRTTLLYAALAVPLSTVVSLAIAALLNRRFPGVNIVRALVFLPTLIPVVASAMVWLWLFNPELGLINLALTPILELVGLAPPDWLGKSVPALLAIVFIGVWSVGQAVVTYVAAMKEVPPALHEAAALDGVSPLGRFYHVTLPMISPVILFNVIIGIIGAWQVFAIPYIMTKGGPDRATYFYSMYLYDNAFVFGPRMGYASAMAWVQLLIVLALTGLTFLVSRRFVHTRA